MKTFLIYGVFGGLLLVMFHFIRYLIDPMWVLGEHQWTFVLISLVVTILVPILAIKSWKRQTRQTASYGVALKFVFICMVTAGIISGTYEFIFNSLKGVNLAIENKEKIKVILKKDIERAYILGYRRMGATEDQINLLREEFELDDTFTDRTEEKWEQYLDRMRIRILPFGLVVGIFSAIPLSMLIALFVRSRKPRQELQIQS